jgi:hypothetical protein
MELQTVPGFLQQADLRFDCYKGWMDSSQNLVPSARAHHSARAQADLQIGKNVLAKHARRIHHG